MASSWSTPHSGPPPGIGEEGGADHQDVTELDVRAACQRGVDVDWLVRWTVKHNLWEVPTWEVVETLIKPATQARRCRFVDLDEEELKAGLVPSDTAADATTDGGHADGGEADTAIVGPADAFISHAWANCWGELVTAAYQFSRSGRRVWVDCMAVNQHEPAMDLELLRNVIGGVPEGLLIVINPHHPLEDTNRNPLRRAWCVFELFNAMMAKVPVLIKMGRKRLPDDPQRQQPSSPHVTAAVTDVKTINPPLPYFETVWDKNKVDNLVGSICLSMVTASRDEDRDRILDHVAQHFDDFKVEETIRNALWAGWTSRKIPALHFAVQGITALKESQVPLEEANPEGWTALHCASASGLVGAVAVLLEAGANPETESNKGRTALIHAAWSGQSKTLEILIAAGANPHAVDRWKRSGAYYASKSQFKGDEWQRCLVILAEEGVKPPPKKPKSKKTEGANGDDGFTIVAPKASRAKSPRGRRKGGKSPTPRGFGTEKGKGRGRGQVSSSSTAPMVAGRGRGRTQALNDVSAGPAPSTAAAKSSHLLLPPQQGGASVAGSGNTVDPQRNPSVSMAATKGAVRHGVKRWASIAAGDPPPPAM